MGSQVRLRQRIGTCLPFALCLLCACDVYDARLTQIAHVHADREEPDASADDPAAEPSMLEDAGDGCSSNPDPDAKCRVRCNEVCNGRDDDCDGRVDETPADLGCSSHYSDAVCREGSCVIVRCLADHRDCDQRSDNGCEVEPDDQDHCGTCNHRCDIDHARSVCVTGHCHVVACVDGYADCDEDGTSCETRTDSLLHCGGCDHACPELAHASSRCVKGECQFDRCAPGYEDCDHDPKNGCEAALDTLENCGACGKACALANCAGGRCSPVQCDGEVGSADCDGDQKSCEVDLRSDVMHCGTCSNRCRFLVYYPHGQLACASGRCGVTCDAGYADCDGRYENGCETSLTTLNDCGACGRTCAIADAIASCASGRCEVDHCAAGYDDCDQDRKSCETALDTAETCGACNSFCKLDHAISRCVLSSTSAGCAVAGCEGEWGDCDGLAANGCERDQRAPDRGGLGACLPDVDCTKYLFNDNQFYLCASARSWDDARDHCRSQLRGDLAHVPDAATRDFLKSKLTTRTWIGHTDAAIEGLWVWAYNRVPFWQGTASGHVLNAGFANWASGEPNASGNCGAMYNMSGEFDDYTCANALPYLCEVSPDACPANPDKYDPGQCGCNKPDTDANADGFAECGG